MRASRSVKGSNSRGAKLLFFLKAAAALRRLGGGRPKGGTGAELSAYRAVKFESPAYGPYLLSAKGGFNLRGGGYNLLTPRALTRIVAAAKKKFLNFSALG